MVLRGGLVIGAGTSEAALGIGDAVFFRADGPHAYQDPGAIDTVFHLTMSYAGDWIDDMAP